MMLRKLTSAMILMGVAGMANADTLSYSTTIPTSTVPFSTTVTLPAFDPANGTLTGVTITIGTSVVANVEIFNNTGTTQTFTNATASVPVTITAPPSYSTTVTATATVASGSLNPSPPPNVFPGVTATASDVITVAAADFGDYTGGGGATVSFGASAASGNYAGNSVSGVFFGGSANAGGTIDIVYTYTPTPQQQVPEPASIALMGLGLAGLGLWRRRKA